MSRRRQFGSLRRLPSGRWQARYRHPTTGEMVSGARTFPSKTEAARFLATVEADLARQVWRDPARRELAFSEIAELWFAAKIHLRETTRLTYRGLLDVHVLPFFGARAIGSITSLDVQAWIADRRSNRRRSPNTVAKAYRVLKAVMESAVDAEVIARNPCRIKGAGKERLPELRFATPEDVAALAGVVDERWRALVLLAAYGGLRWGELAALRRRHFDMLHRTVRVAEQAIEINGTLTWGPPKTEAGVRTVALPSFLVDLLEAHLASFGGPDAHDLVFVTADGAPLRRHNFRKRVWLPACAVTGLEGLRFHDLRHTNATLAAASGAPLRALMTRLGHASSDAALRYQHRMAGQDEAIAAFLDTVGRAAQPSPLPPVVAFPDRVG
ncbi:MAG: site-specific integrase [Acidimicrobiales bacterium]